MIINNKIIAEVNKKKIQEDFDIYKLTKEGKQDFYKNNVLDLPTGEFKARSVVYTWGNVWYALFDKNKVDKEKFKKVINDESPNTRVEKVNILEEDIYNNILVQLIINMLYSKDVQTEYHNITGKLYFLCNDWMKKDSNDKLKTFYCLKLSISPDMYMKLEVETFSRVDCFKEIKFKYKPQYVFDKNSKAFRKKLKNDDFNEEEIFIQKSLNSKKHNTVPFLDFKSYKNFKKCKVGVLAKFMSDVEQELHEYITIKNGEYENYITFDSSINNDFENKNYTELLKDKKFIIEDLVNTTKSKELIDKIIIDLKTEFKVNARRGNLNKDAYNLRIINVPEYYKENELEDPHDNVGDSIVVQHRTIESFKSFDDSSSEYKIKQNNKREKATLVKIIQELIIKDNLINKKLSLVNWKTCNYENSWVFVKRKKVEYNNDNEKKEKYIYCKMEIFKDGTFSLEYFDDSKDYPLDSEFNNIEAVFDKYKYNSTRAIEGIFYKSKDNINTILATEQYTMPNYRRLEEVMKITHDDEKLSVLNIIGCLNNLCSDDQDIIHRRNELVDELSTLPNYATRKEINKKLNIRKSASKLINKYIYDKTGILINGEVNSEKNRDEYFIPILDIKYFYINKILYYFVGVEAKNLQQSFNNACVIRQVVADEENEFEEIIRLLKVEFVRNGLNTVVPFPFKYLNEALSRY